MEDPVTWRADEGAPAVAGGAVAPASGNAAARTRGAGSPAAWSAAPRGAVTRRRGPLPGASASRQPPGWRPGGPVPVPGRAAR